MQTLQKKPPPTRVDYTTTNYYTKQLTVKEVMSKKVSQDEQSFAVSFKCLVHDLVIILNWDLSDKISALFKVKNFFFIFLINF